MKISENIIPLSLEEVIILQKKRTKIIIALSKIEIFSLGVLFFFFRNNLNEIVFFVLLGCVTVLLIVISFIAVKQINKDLYKDIKKIIIGTIDNKLIEFYKSPSYYLFIGNEKIFVDKKTYQQYEIGAKIEIHITFYSQHVFIIKYL